jgi:ATP-dependent RNA helicase DDX10/DBP4
MEQAKKSHRRRPHQPPVRPKNLKRKREVEDLASLSQRVEALDTTASPTSFAELPLSKPTSTGLEASRFTSLTDIQKRAIPHALKGNDILGAAKTGSGKTLAFLVPVLENLYRRKWTEYDGLGALILSPTRELAIQIFEVLRKIGRYHSFSAGLVIGGKSLKEERERLGRMNILVCTPGRMLQHLDQTAEFEVGNLQMLVLDEADRIMDMGFQVAVDAIIDHLPKSKRQTMLFSATQTKKVSDLARLNLKDPEYVSVHEQATSATPSRLQQHYIVTPLPEKLDTLWSFIRSNLKSKILVFMSSGKQVRFVYESFRHMQPGVPLLHLHGRQKQGARLEITNKFSDAQHSCLFSTDVAARGLDFPAVDWVIQLDCPEDADTYIHRVGRTARYECDGRAVLFLEPTEEEGMLSRLEHKKVPIEKINVREKKKQTIQNQLQNLCFKDPELKYLGQKAFVSYVRSIHIQKDKEVFKINELPLEEFATSLGLPGAPRIKFVKGEDAKKLKNAPRFLHSPGESEDEADGGLHSEKRKENAVRTKYDRMFERRNQDILTDHYTRLIDDRGDENVESNTADADSDNDFLSVKQRFEIDDPSLGSSSATNPSSSGNGRPSKTVTLDDGSQLVIDSERRSKLLKSKKKLLPFKGKGHKFVYDDEGNQHEVYEMEDEESFKKRGAPQKQREEFVRLEGEKLRERDIADKEIVKAKRAEKKEKRKRREREEREMEKSGGRIAVLGAGDEDDYVDGGVEEDIESPKASAIAQGREKKWFEDSDEEGEEAGARKGKKRKRNQREQPAPETLEDLEAMAEGLLG